MSAEHPDHATDKRCPMQHATCVGRASTSRRTHTLCIPYCLLETHTLTPSNTGHVCRGSTRAHTTLKAAAPVGARHTYIHETRMRPRRDAGCTHFLRQFL